MITPGASKSNTEKAHQPALRVQEDAVDQLRQYARGGWLYAVLDSTDCPLVPKKCQELGPEYAVSLFRGSAQEEYWAVAPYLVRVDEAMLDWVLAVLWKEPWGIFAISKATLEELRTHFRRFLTVLQPDGNHSYFRYYDPRLLKIYLEKCDEATLQTFFGPIKAFHINGNTVIAKSASDAMPLPKQQSIFRITTQQRCALDGFTAQLFLNKLERVLAEMLPNTVGDTDKRSQIARFWGAAVEYGFVTERQVTGFVYVRLLLGQRFDQSPFSNDFTRIMKQSVTPDEKIERLKLAAHYYDQLWP